MLENVWCLKVISYQVISGDFSYSEWQDKKDMIVNSYEHKMKFNPLLIE